MSPAAAPITTTTDREVIVERTFDAPRELVWAAFTDVRHLDQWWGPNGFRNQTSAMKLEVGGVWRYLMHGPDGKAWVNWIRYQQIEAPARLEYDHGGEGDEPAFHVVITFTAVGARTRVKMHSVFPTAAALEEVKKYGAIEGGYQTLARLGGHLYWLKQGRAENAMVITRVFDAPAKLVFEAWSTAEALKRWWGPKGWHTPIVELDFRTGGAYRMVMKGPHGEESAFHGTFTQIVPNELIVMDAEIEGLNLFVTSTITFVEENGKTILTARQDRPAHKEAAAGQMEGWSGQLEKLAAMLAAAA